MARKLSPRAAFRRRLALLMAAFALAGTAMAAQLVRLGVGRAEASLAEAERRLYREQWIPTVRGRILDRQGRVLAQNRPSYEVAIEYQVLSGEWAERNALDHARRFYAPVWSLLTAAQRDELVGRFRPLYGRHVAEMEARLQQAMGMSAARFAERKQETLDRVTRVSDTVTRARLEKYRQEQLELGREVTPEIEAVLLERASQPIAQEREPHVIGDVSDDVAFQLIALQDAHVPIEPVGVEPVYRDAPEADDLDLAPRMPGLVVRRSEDREYPFDAMSVKVDRSSLPGPITSDVPLDMDLVGVASHILGWMGDRVLGMDVERRAAQLKESPALSARALVRTLDSKQPADRGRYLPGDPVARAGVEGSREAQLRGLRGLRIDRLDTGEQTLIPPEAGADVRLTVDIALQARVQAILDPRFGLAQIHPWQGAVLPLPVGTPLNGAAVIVEVDSGDVLAMVSTPEFSREELREHPEKLIEDEVNRPLLNRAIAAPYPPGSILKALILTGAVTHGNYRLGDRIACNGHLYPNRPDMLRCWIYREQYGMSTHSVRLGRDVDAVDALTVSCNIFFYTMGRRMGPRGVAQTLHEYGVGELWGLGIGEEFPGRIGSAHRLVPKPGQESVPEDEREMMPVYLNDGSDLAEFDATLMGIGQGPVAWTPLHAASAYATLARMGVYIRPRVIDDGLGPQVRETSFDRHAIDAALKGLDGVVNNREYGTANGLTTEAGREPIFNAPGVHVWGKTGTATAPLFDPDGPSGPLKPLEEPLHHAWVTVLVGREGDRPRYAISVIMEYAGSGGRVSGPLANQIIHALIAEGYL